VPVGFVLLAVAAVALLSGAELFAEHAASAGRRLGVTGLAVGLLLAGAEPEELITAVVAAARDRPGIGVGDAVGANLTMLTLVLGLAALIRPITIQGRPRRYAAFAGAAAAAAAAVLIDGQVGRVEGVLLLAAYVAFVALVWRREQEAPAIGELAELAEEDEEDENERGTTTELLLALGGVALMGAGGGAAVEGAARVAEALSITDTAVGLTLVALVTTAELLALVWSSTRRSIPELAVAAVFGSAAYNATVTLGAAAIVTPASDLDVRSAAVAATLLIVALVVLGRVGRVAAAGLVAGYVVFVSIGLG